MERNTFRGIPIVTKPVVDAALIRGAYTREELQWVGNRLAAREPNLSDYIKRNTVDVLRDDLDFAFFHGITGGIGTRRERRVAQNIVLHTVALLADQAGYYKTGWFGNLSLDELLPVYSMRDDVFMTLRRERQQEQNHKTERIAKMERLTRVVNPLLAEEIELISGYGTRWQRWREGVEPGLRPFQAGYVTTYGVIAAISMQASRERS